MRTVAALPRSGSRLGSRLRRRKTIQPPRAPFQHLSVEAACGQRIERTTQGRIGFVGVPGHQQEIDAGIQRSLDRMAETGMLYGSHSQVIGDGDAIEAPLIAEGPVSIATREFRHRRHSTRRETA